VTSLFTILDQIKKVADETATALGKPVQIHFPPKDSLIAPTWQLPLTLVLTHLVRNSIDHGFAQDGGEIWFRTPPSDSMWILEMEDSGAGVSLEKIKVRAVQLGLLMDDDNPSRNALLELLFYPGFTTRESSTPYSGRGIGMDIVLHEILKLGGQIHLLQNEKKGLQIQIEIPLTSTR